MGMSMNWIMMLLTMSLGGNDLLDMANTNAYWESKGVTVSVGAMLAELSPATVAVPDVSELVKQLGDRSLPVREKTTGKLASMSDAIRPQLEKALASQDPEVVARAKQVIGKLTSGGQNAPAIRRLMAIRTLGELKDAKALGELKKLQDSPEPFVAEYVRRAIASIEGKAYARPIPSDADMKKDLALLPKSCAAVIQARMVYETTTMAGLLELISKSNAQEGGPGIPVEVVDEKQVTQGILNVVETAGNARLDALTVGVSGNIGSNDGFVVLVGRGQFDPAALKVCGLAEQKAVAARYDEMGLPPDHPVRTAMAATSRPFDKGVEVIPFFGRGGIMFTSNDRAAFVIDAGRSRPPQAPMAPGTGPATRPTTQTTTQPAVERDDPMAQVSKGLVADKAEGGVLGNPEMAKLLTGVDMSKPLWGAMMVTEWYRGAPMLAGFKSIVASATYKDHSLAATLTASGTSAEECQASVESFNKGIAGIKADLARESQRVESLKGFVEALESIELKEQGLTVSGTAKLDKPGRLLQLPLLMSYIRYARYTIAQRKGRP